MASHGRKRTVKNGTFETVYVGAGNYSTRPDKIEWDVIHSENPYQDLGNAVVAQAYKDYISVAFASYSIVRTKNGEIIDYNHNLKDLTVNHGEIIDFFNSPLYTLITDIPGDAMIRMAENEIEMIKEAYRDGLIWDQFLIKHINDRISITKNDYEKMYENIRLKHALEQKIRMYEQQAHFDPETERVYRITKRDLPPATYPNAIYVLVGYKLAFYKYDKKHKDYYKIFNGNRILSNSSKHWYKDSAYYKKRHKNKKGE